jgi:hypothetical protein
MTKKSRILHEVPLAKNSLVLNSSRQEGRSFLEERKNDFWEIETWNGAAGYKVRSKKYRKPQQLPGTNRGAAW